MHAAVCIANITWWTKRHNVGRMVIPRASTTYVIASHVASAAGRMGLIAGNRLSVKPRRYYRGLIVSASRQADLDRAIVMSSATESGRARPATDLCDLSAPRGSLLGRLIPLVALVTPHLGALTLHWLTVGSK